MAIAQNNTDISAGQIKSEDEEILIRSRRRSVDPNDIANIIIRANADGTMLKIGDVGIVKTKFADVSNYLTVNGNQSVGFFVSKLVDEDLKEISEFIYSYVDEFNAKHEKVKMYITFDFMTLLKARLNLLVSNGLFGLLLVVIVLGFFLSIRLSFWVAFGIPASFLGMFLIAPLFGINAK